MIAVTGLSKHFGAIRAVDNISFDVAEGENLILLGASGCGKTTTLKMLNRLIAPSAGSIRINGEDVARQNPDVLRRSIGYVLQHNSLFPHYTVAENIAVVPQLLKWDKKSTDERTAQLLQKLNLPPEKLGAWPHELSGGQQQRVNIARALAAGPPVLLMDEPFGALDNITRAVITKEFSQIDEFMRKTIVMVTHDVQEAFLLGDRIALMHDGRIVQCGKPLELLFRPVNDFVREFFASSYLRLALGTITLDDIWSRLPEAADNAHGLQASAATSLWAAMEMMVKSRSDVLTISNTGGATKTIKREDVFREGSNYAALNGSMTQ